MPTDKLVLTQNLRSILQRVNDAWTLAIKQTSTQKNVVISKELPRLVAVSKFIPSQQIAICYEEGQQHFGENYFQELDEKSHLLEAQCPNILWHFIGRLQSNKIKRLCETPNLWCVETLDNVKHSDLLQKYCAELGRQSLNVFIQINTSNEENKGGIKMNESSLSQLVRHIYNNCPNLTLKGLMTIGLFEQSQQKNENKDFLMLLKAREQVCSILNLPDVHSLELSMGMSSDFELAICYGSTNIRVGSSIFGMRQKK